MGWPVTLVVAGGLMVVSPRRNRAVIPVDSFEMHARLEQTTSIYSPHVLILEGIFALHDPRVLDLMDMRVMIFNCLQ